MIGDLVWCNDCGFWHHDPRLWHASWFQVGGAPPNFGELAVAARLMGLLWMGIWRLRVAGVVGLGAEGGWR